MVSTTLPKRLGLTGARSHAGYLIHTFLSPLSNHRTDQYGGTFENRSRLLMEIVDGIRAVWPADKALFVRLSSVDVGWGIDQTIELVRELQQHEVDVIDCSSGGLTGLPASHPPRKGTCSPGETRSNDSHGR